MQLPQDLPDEFRVYGNPGAGVNQYGTPAAMGVIGAASHAWTADGRAPFYVGDMSNSTGTDYGHTPGGDHTTGTGIDIRPVRKDGRNEGTNYNDPSYDREATQRLVDTLRATGAVKDIFFDDAQISGVRSLGPKYPHANHLHVRVDPDWQRPLAK